MIIKKLLSDKTNYHYGRMSPIKGRMSPIKYIVIHYTGNKGDTALANAKYFTKPHIGASAHYFVDSKEIYNTVDDSDTAWHCGALQYRHSFCRNRNSIGIEICSEFKSGRFYTPEETLKNVVELVKSLMKTYNIPLENVVRHYDVTGKLCPAQYIDEDSWKGFKELLK